MESCDQPAESSDIFSFSKEKVGECMSGCVCVCVYVCVCLEREASIQDPDTDNFIKYWFLKQIYIFTKPWAKEDQSCDKNNY